MIELIPEQVRTLAHIVGLHDDALRVSVTQDPIVTRPGWGDRAQSVRVIVKTGTENAYPDGWHYRHYLIDREGGMIERAA